MYAFSKIGKRVLSITLVFLLMSSISLTIFTHPHLDAQTGYSGYSNAQLAAALTESVDRFNNISSILDKAVVTDLANGTIHDLESDANSLLPQGQTKSRLIHILDTAESALVDAGNFVTEGDITGAGSMLNITSDITSAFITGVQKERGKSISNSTADILIANATTITEILQLQGIEVNPLILSSNYSLPLATANLAASKAEMEDIQAIIAEFQSRGFVIELDADHGSPWFVVVSVITAVDVIINAPGLAAATTDAVNEALIAEGEAPLTEDEKIRLAILNVAIYAGISETTAVATSHIVKPLFIKAGLRTTNSVNIHPSDLVRTFVSNQVASDVYLYLEPGLIESDKNLIIGLRNVFGNNISGFVYEDTNGTGVKDPFEEGLAAWTVTLRDSLGSVIETYVTSGTGLYDFKGLVDGNYTVTETVNSGWVNSTITTLAFELEEENRHPTNNFGNYRPSQINGMKFNDADGDGIKDAGESVLSNWNITLKNPTTDAILASVITNANGLYSFTNLRPGNYVIEEVQQSGYTQTSPSAPGTYSVTITSGSNITSRDFGNKVSGPVTVTLVASYDADVVTTNTQSSICGTPNLIEAGTTVPGAEVNRNTISTYCTRSFFEIDTSSIPDTATITSVVFKFEVQVVQTAGGSFSCNYTPIATRPSTVSSPQSAWNDIGDGTAYVTGNTACASAGTNKSVTLGTSANTDLQNSLSSDWFGVGLKQASETRSSTGDKITRFKSIEYSPPATPKPTIEVTYNVP